MKIMDTKCPKCGHRGVDVERMFFGANGNTIMKGVKCSSCGHKMPDIDETQEWILLK